MVSTMHFLCFCFCPLASTDNSPDEDLRYATDLKEHDYLGGCIFSLGQLMGAKGCTLAKRLAREKSYMIIVGNGALAFLREALDVLWRD